MTPSGDLARSHITIDDDALNALATYANGDARTALNALELAASVAPDARDAGAGAGTRQSTWRPSRMRCSIARCSTTKRRGTLQPDLGAAQIAARLRSRRRALLAWAHAGGGRRSTLRRAAADSLRQRGCRHGRSAGADGLCRGAAGGSLRRHARSALALAQAVVHLATAPKSNALYTAYSAVQEDVRATRNDPVPLQLRNAPTGLMKQTSTTAKATSTRTTPMRASPTPKTQRVRRPSAHKTISPSRCATANITTRRRQGGEASIAAWLRRRRKQ